MTRPDIDQLQQLFIQPTPLLDTRAPIEFAAGAFPDAVNLPLMTDSEREQVGICYKQKGQASAIELGHRLVSGAERDARMEAWRDFARLHPEGYLYCFRGGLRSRTVQQWLSEAGCDYPLVIGGYKAMRRYLLDALDRSVSQSHIVLVGGATGSGKTRVVEQLGSAVDLEGLARHRGSAFGHLVEDQPTQIDFENSLSIALLRHELKPVPVLHLEDEGKLIGRLSLPKTLLEKMQAAPLLVIDEPVESRVGQLVNDYVVDLGARFTHRFGEQGGQRHLEKLLSDVERIRKRLGGERAQRVADLLREAFAAGDSTLAPQLHSRWIAILLTEYYDPMYRYQMDKRAGSVVFRGTREEVLAFAHQQAMASK
jgi:tRNA 2-selenouridine synthase